MKSSCRPLALPKTPALWHTAAGGACCGAWTSLKLISTICPRLGAACAKGEVTRMDWDEKARLKELIKRPFYRSSTSRLSIVPSDSELRNFLPLLFPMQFQSLVRPESSFKINTHVTDALRPVPFPRSEAPLALRGSPAQQRSGPEGARAARHPERTRAHLRVVRRAASRRALAAHGTP